MVNPGGTGSASTDVISARLAPLPPRRSLSSMGGRACVWSKSKTYGIGPPCPGMANRVHAVRHEVIVLRPRVQSRAKASAYWPAAAPSVGFVPLLAPVPARDLALEDLLGLPHEVAHDGQFLGLEALRDL